ncbi:MAG: porin family protein [Colwellia sp.]|nr:porin family protein [Colwellia sp.]
MNKLIPSLLAVALISTSANATESEGSVYVKADMQKLEFNGYSLDVQGITGGYQFNENIALQASYLIGDEYGVDYTAMKLDLVGIAPLNENVALVGEIGLSTYEEDYNNKYYKNYTDTAIHTGVGIMFHTEQVSLTFAYHSYALNDAEIAGTGFGVSLGFKF